MQSRVINVFVVSALAVLTAGCVTDQKTAQVQLEQQAVLGLNWVQQSGEYEALAYQAFNTARRAFDTAKVEDGRKKAVIVELDETMIDNSAYAAWRVKQARFARVKSKGYDVVVHADNKLNDFGAQLYGKNNSERWLLVATQQNKFGSKFIMLPNQNYCTWISGMAIDYYMQTPAKQLQINRENLKVWKGRYIFKRKMFIFWGEGRNLIDCCML